MPNWNTTLKYRLLVWVDEFHFRGPAPTYSIRYFFDVIFEISRVESGGLYMKIKKKKFQSSENSFGIQKPNLKKSSFFAIFDEEQDLMDLQVWIIVF